MTSKQNNIQRVLYQVTNDFGSNNIGDIRQAYRVAGELQNQREPILIFHPKDINGSGSLEMALLNPKTGFFESLTDSPYINLNTKEERLYRAMVKSVYGPIPNDLTIDPIVFEKAHLEKSIPKTKTLKKMARL